MEHNDWNPDGEHGLTVAGKKLYLTEPSFILGHWDIIFKLVLFPEKHLKFEYIGSKSFAFNPLEEKIFTWKPKHDNHSQYCIISVCFDNAKFQMDGKAYTLFTTGLVKNRGGAQVRCLGQGSIKAGRG